MSGTGDLKRCGSTVPPVTLGPRRSTRQRVRRVVARRGSSAPTGGTEARGSSRRTGGCGGQAGSAALLRRGARRRRKPPYNAAHTLAGFGGAAAASPQAAARTAKGRHAADAAHPVCTDQQRARPRKWPRRCGAGMVCRGMLSHGVAALRLLMRSRAYVR